MDVYLVRHAIAENRDAGRWPDDSERPLTPEGSARFRKAARGLRRLAPHVDILLSSPYVRAWQTALILAETNGWPAPERCEQLAATSSPSAALEPLRAHAGAASVALVGHEPFLSSLAALLLTGSDDGLRLVLKKGGVVLLSFDGEPSPGDAALHWSAPPRLLRALAPDHDPA